MDVGTHSIVCSLSKLEDTINNDNIVSHHLKPNVYRVLGALEGEIWGLKGIKKLP